MSSVLTISMDTSSENSLSMQYDGSGGAVIQEALSAIGSEPRTSFRVSNGSDSDRQTSINISSLSDAVSGDESSHTRNAEIPNPGSYEGVSQNEAQDDDGGLPARAIVPQPISQQPRIYRVANAAVGTTAAVAAIGLILWSAIDLIPQGSGFGISALLGGTCIVAPCAWRFLSAARRA